MEIYRDAYSVENIAHGDTNQESGEYATRAYLKFVVERVLQPGMRVLDFGAGSGFLVEQFRLQGVAADGLEFSEAARRGCAATRGIELLSDLDEGLASQYDLVTMIEVIEHVTDLWATLGQIYKALKPGGHLLVTTPNRRGWRAIVEQGYYGEARKKFHLFLFDERSLRHHIQATGFAQLRRVRSAPVLKPGFLPWAVTRATQLLGVPGSLCVVARRA